MPPQSASERVTGFCDHTHRKSVGGRKSPCRHNRRRRGSRFFSFFCDHTLRKFPMREYANVVTRTDFPHFRAQLRWLGHILRKPENDPVRKVLFEPNSFYPHTRPRSLTFWWARRKRGHPHADWAGIVSRNIEVNTRRVSREIETPLPPSN